MKKKFNITGTCFPEDHYMADVSKKLDQIYTLVEDGEYFIINRPRQYGKTTTLHTLAHHFRATGEYLIFICFANSPMKPGANRLSCSKIISPSPSKLILKTIYA